MYLGSTIVPYLRKVEMSLEPHRTDFNIRRAGVVFLNRQKSSHQCHNGCGDRQIFRSDPDPQICNPETDPGEQLLTVPTRYGTHLDLDSKCALLWPWQKICC
jgi:hypothetical protein